jgi:hypothetical protein
MGNPNLNIKEIEQWWKQRPLINNAFSIESMRAIISMLLTGRNYRLIAEKCVKEKLYLIHAWLLKIIYNAKELWGDNWLKELLLYFKTNPIQVDELDLLKYVKMWLLGIGEKTARNLDLSNYNEAVVFLNEVISQCKDISQTVPWITENVTIDLKSSMNVTSQSFSLEETLLFLQIIGASTLTIRGSNKAKYGKVIEKVFLKTCLDILGFEEEVNYWIYDLNRDNEVERQIDGEVETRRGRIRIEVTLIGKGNSEVGEDKMNRIGTNGILIVDCLGPKSGVYETARNNHVKLIQIRHTLPLVELYNHLVDKVKINLNNPGLSETEILEKLNSLPDSTFLLE